MCLTAYCIIQMYCEYWLHKKIKLFLIMQCNHFDHVSIMSRDFCTNMKETATLQYSDICFTAAWIKLFLSSSNPYIIPYSNFYLQRHFQQLSFSQCFGNHHVNLLYFTISSKSSMASLLNILGSDFKLMIASFALLSQWKCQSEIHCANWRYNVQKKILIGKDGLDSN